MMESDGFGQFHRLGRHDGSSAFRLHRLHLVKEAIRRIISRLGTDDCSRGELFRHCSTVEYDGSVFPDLLHGRPFLLIQDNYFAFPVFWTGLWCRIIGIILSTSHH